MNSNNAHMLNYIMSFLLRKVVVPSDFHDRAEAIKKMLDDDVTGLVDSLTDFAVNSANVAFTVETNNDEFDKILAKWLNEINSEYKGQIPSGIKPLAKEYFKERWKGASFPVLKIAKWGTVNGIAVPTKMFFVDGGSIIAKDKDENDNNLKLINYDYYLGGTESENKLDANVLITKPYGRWFDKYPTPYLIKRGIYHNFSIIQSLKNKEWEILTQIIPYLFLVKKGTEKLAVEGTKIYNDTELQGVVTQFQNLINEIKTDKVKGTTGKTPIRATQFDEEIKHLIPDLSTIFNPTLFSQAERNILSGLGFIDVIEATSSSRRESILNPKVFIEEVKSGVEDFKQILKELVILIQKKNENHIKYMNSTFYIIASPVKAFMTGEFKNLIRSMYDRGRVSSQTAIELIAEVDFDTEVHRREQEEKKGISEILYPPIIRNTEEKGIDLPSDLNKTPEDLENEEKVPEEKKNEIEKQNYDMSKINLEGSPYPNLKSLPDYIKKKYNKTQQNKWRKIWNEAYKYMFKKSNNAKKAESYAFRVANNALRKLL